MRITVVGAVLIVAAAIAAVLVIRALNDKGDRGPKQTPGPVGPTRL
jgi:hypothetical protein